MTCFWDGIMSSLTTDDFKGMCKSNFANQKEFVDWLIAHNHITEGVKWNSSSLKFQELEENFRHISEFQSSSIYNGYDCSVSDPFLYIIASLFNVNISHDYNGSQIIYNVDNPLKTLKFKSNRGHFWKE